MKNDKENRGGRTKQPFALMRRGEGGGAACSLNPPNQTECVHSVTDLGQNTIQDAFTYLVELHLSRLSGLNKADH